MDFGVIDPKGYINGLLGLDLLIIDLQTLFLKTRYKTAEQHQLIEEMKIQERERKETIKKQQESIIEMQDFHKEQ